MKIKNTEKIKKEYSKLYVILTLSISMLFVLLTTTHYAANEVANNNNTNTNTNKTTISTSKSSNANLSDLGIKPYDFKGFKPTTTSYQVTVPETTEFVEIYAKAQHEKATIKGTGKQNLEKRENQKEIVVTAEDGTTKTYTITIVREVQQEETTQDTEEASEEVEGLSGLKIENVNLTPEFKTNIYEYTGKYIGESVKLAVETMATNEDYIVEVTGNEDLQEGENVVTILVSNEKGENVATYQITINKSLIDEEAVAREMEQKEEQKKIIISVALAVIVLGIIIGSIIKYRRNQEFEEYDDDEEEIEEIEEVEENEDNEQDIEEEDEVMAIEKMSKEELKEQFLNNYNNYQEEYEEEDKPDKSKKQKGKRFK